MNSWKSRLAGVALLVAAVATAAAAPRPFPGERNVMIPELPREFRAAWVATVANIDWPSSRNLTTEEQQKELIAILDQIRNLNMNAVVLQIRPAADAMYKSDLEPWSEYLTGEQGKAPEPYYDPLEFAVEEAHKRGIELHVWFNPYRARLMRSERTSTGTVYKAPKTDPNHISVTHPEVVKTYGSHQWMDPGEPVVQQHSLNVILDVVKRYDIDGVHMDDYFYPYPIADPETKKEIDFPDEPSWTRYKESGGRLERNDWRRENVNKFIRELYQRVKQEKRHVLVGLSPFGIWKPGYPEQIKGFNQYEKLYADAKLWLNRGWVDYWTPQLYWRVQDLAQSYPVLLEWWMKENTQDRHMWPGYFTTKATFGPDEIINQIVLTRFLGATGHVHFSMKGLLPEGDKIKLLERLTTSTGVYAQPTVSPETTWLGGAAPYRPRNLQVKPLESAPAAQTTQTASLDESEGNYIPAAEDAPTTGTAAATAAAAADAGTTAPATAEADAATTAAAAAAAVADAPTSPSAELKEADVASTPAMRRRGMRRARREAGETTAPAATQTAPAAKAEAPKPPKKAVEVSWQPADHGTPVRVYGVWTGKEAAGNVAWTFHFVPGSQTTLKVEADDNGNFPTHYAVTAISRLGQASSYATTKYDAAGAAAAEQPKETYGQVQ